MTSDLRPLRFLLAPVAERLVKNCYLRGGVRLFEEVVGVGGDFCFDQLFLNVVVNVLQFGDDATGRLASSARDVGVAVVGLYVLLRDYGEGAEAEVQVLLYADAVLHYLAELRRVGAESDAAEALVEGGLRWEETYDALLLVRNLLLRRRGGREFLGLLQDQPLVNEQVERAARSEERRVGTEWT